jgi:hypothetical protein
VAQIASRSWDAAAKSGETRKVARPLPQPMIKTPSNGNGAHKSAPVKAAPATPRLVQKPAPPKVERPTARAVNDVSQPVSKRPLQRAGVWIAIGAAAAIYIVAMYVIILA